MGTFLQITDALEPLFLAGTSLGIIILAFTVYHSDRRNATNIIFGLLGLSILLWIWSGYIAGLTEMAPFEITFHRLAIFFAAPMSTLFFLLAYTLPSPKFLMKKKRFFLILALTALMMIINISPYAFVRTVGASNLVAGPGLIPFALISSVFSLLAIYYLFKKYSASGKEEQVQFGIVLLGIFTMLLLIIGTILIPIIIFQSGAFLPFLSIYALIFFGMTAYAITKYQLFNIKVILTQAITIVIWITLFSKIFISETLLEKGIDSLIFLITVIFGISLIRSVRKEIQLREEVQKQKKELEIANRGQEDLIHILNHQIKGYLTTGRFVFSELLEEPEYGLVRQQARTLIEKGLNALTSGVKFVQGVLNASNIAAGTFTYSMEPINVKSLVIEAIEKQKENALKKGLVYDEIIADGEYLTDGDSIQLKETFKNIIDNSIHYTPKGSIHISLSRKGDKILFAVIDTGIGLSDEDKSKLFTRGGRGKNSMKINVNSTGYGLSFVKGVVEAHGGRVWAESQGSGQGSQFYIELPVKRNGSISSLS